MALTLVPEQNIVHHGLQERLQQLPRARLRVLAHRAASRAVEHIDEDEVRQRVLVDLSFWPSFPHRSIAMINSVLDVDNRDSDHFNLRAIRSAWISLAAPTHQSTAHAVALCLSAELIGSPRDDENEGIGSDYDLLDLQNAQVAAELELHRIRPLTQSLTTAPSPLSL